MNKIIGFDIWWADNLPKFEELGLSWDELQTAKDAAKITYEKGYDEGKIKAYRLFKNCYEAGETLNDSN